jgi:hypothetical protein
MRSFIICILHQILVIKLNYETGRTCSIRKAYKILIGKPEGRDHLGNLDIDGILK